MSSRSIERQSSIDTGASQTPLASILSPASYTFFLHRHRYAAWAASRAAQRGLFTVEIGRKMIEEAELPWLLMGKKYWPCPNIMDEFNRQKRFAIITAAHRHEKTISHGRAAKLIAVYLKAGTLNEANCDDPLISALHPPIDGEMLKSIVKSGQGDTILWRRLKEIGWTKFGSDDYEAAISGLRQLLAPGAPLWMAEQFWGGYQGAWKLRGCGTDRA